MAPLGPFGQGRQIAVAVSGGADSMALAYLLRRWGDPLAIIIDHALRPGSAHEAALTQTRLAVLGIPARLHTLQLPPGPNLGARARARHARYAALLQATREAGRPDLLVAHHAADQAETVILRRNAGSRPHGLAAMAAITWRGDARILRPLLPILPARLRATLRKAGVPWIEDPTNHDPTTPRGALRATPIDIPAHLRTAATAAASRQAAETAQAQELAHHVTIHPTGHAEIDGTLSPEAWSQLIWTISGRPYPPPYRAVLRLIANRGGTLHGVLVRNNLVMREPANLPPPIPAHEGATWDNRFTLRTPIPGATLGALQTATPPIPRRPGLPRALLQGLPVIRNGTDLLMSPHLLYLGIKTWHTVQVEFRSARPMAGAPFVPVLGTDGAGGCT